MAQPLDNAALDQLFDKARTHNKWQPREVPDDLLKKIVEHMKWGPTSANCSPARIVFVKSQEAKARLKPHLSPGNVEKTMAAPATAILAYDLNFYDYLPRLFPPADAKSWFAGKKAHADITAFRNGTLQGGYFILAARALGLDCGRIEPRQIFIEIRRSYARIAVAGAAIVFSTCFSAYQPGFRLLRFDEDDSAPASNWRCVGTRLHMLDDFLQ